MELFIHNLPTPCKAHLVKRDITKAVKNICGDKVPVDWRPRKNKALGVLTFPTQTHGFQFLTHYRMGITVRNRTAKAKISKHAPAPRLIEGLLKLMEDMKHWDEEDSDAEFAYLRGSPDLHLASSVGYSNTTNDKGYMNKGVPFSSIEFGVWNTDGSFGRCGTIERDGFITHNSEVGKLELQNILDVQRNGLNPWADEPAIENGIEIDNCIIQEVVVDRTARRARLFLTLDRIPLFWSVPSSRHEQLEDMNEEDDQRLRSINHSHFDLARLQSVQDEPRRYRVPALSREHAWSAPYSTVYVLNLDGPDTETRLNRLFKSMRRTVPGEMSIEINATEINLVREINQLANIYASRPYPVAFQMELLVKNCLLLPAEIIRLDPQVADLETKYGVDSTVRIFQGFAARLPLRTYESQSEGVDLDRILMAAEHSAFTWQPRIDPNSVFILRLDVTPAAFNLEGPEWMGSNRFLRLFPNHHDYFLKVSFAEEDLGRIWQTREMSLTAITDGRWKGFLKSEIMLAGRRFEFLGFSSSSLKEHSVWFVSAFWHGHEVDAQSLRDMLGDFSEIRCPPRFAARLGQTFTTTSHSLNMEEEDTKKLRDVLHNGHVFSDGVGTISQSMLERIWDASATNEVVKPVAYQIRFGGAKGVLALDPRLEGIQICLRESMIKFTAPYDQLELANKGKVLPFFLNRQMIVVLESLKLPRENLIQLLDLAIQRLEEASKDFKSAMRLFQQYGLGQASKLTNILKTLQKNKVKEVFDMPFFRRLNSLALSHALKQMKYRTRVAVDNSWVLMGIMDEFDFLEEGHIYVCLRDEKDGTVQFLEGDTMVTRSPALHCG